jgi:hypothetical protein
MQPLDWSNVYDKHRGKWVAFKDDHKTVVGSGSSLESAKQAAAREGCDDPIMMRMPRTLRHFIG